MFEQNELGADRIAIYDDEEVWLSGSELPRLEVINSSGSQADPQLKRQRFVRHTSTPGPLKGCQFVDSAGDSFASF